MVCAACTERLKTSAPADSHAAYVRAVMFGVGGAIAGLILYSVVEIATGLIIGYVSLAVGWLVGKAMMKGSGGIGGRRYQIAAVLLTYAAVSLAAIPVAIAQFSKQKNAQTENRTQNPPSSSADSGTPPGEDHAAPSSAAPPSKEAHPQRSGVSLLGYLLMMGLASPFLELSDPFHGLIGLVILAVGIRIAWQMTQGRQLVFDGPY